MREVVSALSLGSIDSPVVDESHFPLLRSSEIGGY